MVDWTVEFLVCVGANEGDLDLERVRVEVSKEHAAASLGASRVRDGELPEEECRGSGRGRV